MPKKSGGTKSNKPRMVKVAIRRVNRALKAKKR